MDHMEKTNPDNNKDAHSGFKTPLTVNTNAENPATRSKTNIFDTIKEIDKKSLDRPTILPTGFELPKTFYCTQWQSLPNVKLHPYTPDEPLIGRVQGPTGDDDDREKALSEFLCAQCLSTYPRINGIRCGDPVADYYSARVWHHRTLFVVTDGCSWGAKPKRASQRANEKFMVVMEEHLLDMRDVADVGHYLLEALAEAHTLVLNAGMKDPEGEPGATTLLGGLIARMHDGSYACICVNVGDCKAFHYSARAQVVIDITDGNRQSLRSAKDPGGRIGGYNYGQPDLRNLVLYYQPLQEHDLVFVVSDGVHDNLDPQTLGVAPQQLLMDELTWNDVTDARCQIAKSRFRLRLVSILMQRHEWSPRNVTMRLLKHSASVTKKTREWMQANPTKREPTDVIQFPGKMDHTTCLAMRVGSAQQLLAAASSSSSSSSAATVAASSVPAVSSSSFSTAASFSPGTSSPTSTSASPSAPPAIGGSSPLIQHRTLEASATLVNAVAATVASTSNQSAGAIATSVSTPPRISSAAPPSNNSSAALRVSTPVVYSPGRNSDGGPRPAAGSSQQQQQQQVAPQQSQPPAHPSASQQPPPPALPRPSSGATLQASNSVVNVQNMNGNSTAAGGSQRGSNSGIPAKK